MADWYKIEEAPCTSFQKLKLKINMPIKKKKKKEAARY